MENTTKGFDERLEVVSNTIIAAKEESNQILDDKNVVKTRLLSVAGQISIQYEKELDQSKKITKQFVLHYWDKEIKKSTNCCFQKYYKRK